VSALLLITCATSWVCEWAMSWRDLGLHSVALFASIGFRDCHAFRTVSIFDQVEIRVIDARSVSWSAGKIRESRLASQ
jgi:hypothetical protein